MDDDRGRTRPAAPAVGGPARVAAAAFPSPSSSAAGSLWTAVRHLVGTGPPALFGTVSGVLGIIAAFTFSAGVSEAITNPARFGQTWPLETSLGFAGVQDGLGAGQRASRCGSRGPGRGRRRERLSSNWVGALNVGRDLPFIVYSCAAVDPGNGVVLDSGRIRHRVAERGRPRPADHDPAAAGAASSDDPDRGRRCAPG